MKISMQRTKIFSQIKGHRFAPDSESGASCLSVNVLSLGGYVNPDASDAISAKLLAHVKGCTMHISVHSAS